MSAWHSKKAPLQVSNRKACATCPRDMSADDAHKRCQKCRQVGGYMQTSEYFTAWQRQDRQLNGRREHRG